MSIEVNATEQIIEVNATGSTIDINVASQTVDVNATTSVIEVSASYNPGINLPTGGTTGQVLKKQSNTDYDTYWATDEKGVPYVGATGDVDLGEYELKAGQIEFDQSPTGTAGVAVTRWNDTIGSSETTLKGGSVVLKNGVDLVARVVNKVTPNTTLTKASYQAVKVSGAQGQRLAIALAQANNDNNSADTLGLVIETIATNQEGFIMTVGTLEGINTTGSLQGETWADGDVLYLSPTIAGALTNIKPNGSTGHIVVIGYVEYAHANNGKIYVKIMNGWELDELHNVYITSPANSEVLTYESATSLWKNKTIATALGYTPVPSTRTLTINGTAYDLSADRSWTIASGNIYNTDGTLTGDRTVTSNGNSLTILGGKQVVSTYQRALWLKTSNNSTFSVDFALENTFTTTGKLWELGSWSNGTFNITNRTNSRVKLQIDTDYFRFDTSSIFSVLGSKLGFPGLWLGQDETNYSISNYTLLTDSTTGGSTYLNTTGDLSFRKNNAFRGHIFSATGNWVIQTGGTVVDNGYKLDVNGTGRFNAASSGATGYALTVADTNGTAGAQMLLQFSTNTGLVLRSTSSGARVISTNSKTFLGFNYTSGNTIVGNDENGYNTDKLNVHVDSTTDGQGITLFDSGGTGGKGAGINFVWSNASQLGASIRTRVQSGFVNTVLSFHTNNASNVLTEAFRITETQNVLIGSTTNVPSAILAATSTTKGFLPPRMTAAQKTAISTPATGLVIYQTDSTEGLYQYKSTGWEAIGGGGTNIYNSDGTLTGNRTVNMSTYTLTFTGNLTANGNVRATGVNNGTATGKSTHIDFVSASNYGRVQVYDYTAGATLPLFFSASEVSLGVGGLPAASGYQLNVQGQNNTLFSYGGDVEIKLQGNSTGNTQIFFSQSTTNKFSIGYINSISAMRIYNWGTSSAAGAIFAATNNWTIGGTTDAGYKLDVQGTARIGGTLFQTMGTNSINLIASGQTAQTTDRGIFIGGGTFGASSLSVGIGFGLNVGGGAGNTGNVAIGNSANATGGSIAISKGISAATASNGCIAIGGTASSGISIGGTSSNNAALAILGTASGYYAIAIGTNNNANADGAICIGNGSTANHSAILFGYNVKSTAKGQVVIGSSDDLLNGVFDNVYFGSGVQRDGVSNGVGINYTINGSGALGTDFAGGNITIAGGKGTGTGTPGDVIISTATATTTGTTLQSLTNRARIKGGTGQLVLNAYTSSTSFSGTAAGYLAFDSSGNIITTSGTGGGGGGISRSVNVISTTTTAGASASTDYVYLISGTTTLTLPTAVGNTNRYTLKNVGTNTVTINTTSSQTIDGSTSITMAVRYTALDVISDGTNWNII